MISLCLAEETAIVDLLRGVHLFSCLSLSAVTGIEFISVFILGSRRTTNTPRSCPDSEFGQDESERQKGGRRGGGEERNDIAREEYYEPREADIQEL